MLQSKVDSKTNSTIPNNAKSSMPLERCGSPRELEFFWFRNMVVSSDTWDAMLRVLKVSKPGRTWSWPWFPPKLRAWRAHPAAPGGPPTARRGS